MNAGHKCTPFVNAITYATHTPAIEQTNKLQFIECDTKLAKRCWMQQHIEDKRKHARNQARNIRSKWWAAGVCPPVSIEYLAEYSGIWLDFFLVIRNQEFFFHTSINEKNEYEMNNGCSRMEVSLLGALIESNRMQWSTAYAWLESKCVLLRSRVKGYRHEISEKPQEKFSFRFAGTAWRFSGFQWTSKKQ